MGGEGFRLLPGYHRTRSSPPPRRAQPTLNLTRRQTMSTDNVIEGWHEIGDGGTTV